MITNFSLYFLAILLKMSENSNNDLDITMNMFINRNQKDYLIILACNKNRDFIDFLIQQSSNIYFNKYIFDDFKKINFFKRFLYFGLSQSIEIMTDLFKANKESINIKEENNELIISLDIELNVKGTQLDLPKETIEFKLGNNNEEEKEVKKLLIWKNMSNLYHEKEQENKLNLEQENLINKLKEEVSQLKQNIDEKKFTNYFLEDNHNKNDLNKSKIITEYNKDNFEFVKTRLKLFHKDKKLIFNMLYSATINGDQSFRFHKFCDNHQNTLIIIKTDSDNIFGGFAGKTWNSSELGRKKDMKSFLFSLNKKKIFNPKPDSKYHLFCSDKDGPCFYAFSVDDLFLQKGGSCDEIYKCSYDSFENDYELNNGVKEFKIIDLEAYEIKFS